MSRTWLRASRVRWRAREEFRYRRWRRYVHTRPAGDPLRKKWHDLYTLAAKMRRRRDDQLSRLTVAHVDEAGLELIKGFEGLETAPYNDSVGFATIGVGHLLHKSGVTAADRSRWARFTEADALTLLSRDLDRFERAARSVVKRSRVPVNQQMFNALVSLSFNIGTGGFTGSSVALRLAAGDKRGAGDAFLMWVHPPELTGRRRAERSLFLS